MSWNIGDNRNLFLKLRSKLGLYQVVLTTPKTPTEKLTLNVLEMQQVTDIETTDSEKKVSCRPRTRSKGRSNVCVNFKNDKDKLNIVVSRYRKSQYLKDNEIDL